MGYIVEMFPECGGWVDAIVFEGTTSEYNSQVEAESKKIVCVDSHSVSDLRVWEREPD
jgi:dihydrodipicolinate synthase/N-acetylneuraminate lyase